LAGFLIRKGGDVVGWGKFSNGGAKVYLDAEKGLKLILQIKETCNLN
jgi:hypothetical protein